MLKPFQKAIVLDTKLASTMDFWCIPANNSIAHGQWFEWNSSIQRCSKLLQNSKIQKIIFESAAVWRRSGKYVQLFQKWCGYEAPTKFSDNNCNINLILGINKNLHWINGWIMKTNAMQCDHFAFDFLHHTRARVRERTRTHIKANSQKFR